MRIIYCKSVLPKQGRRHFVFVFPYFLSQITVRVASKDVIFGCFAKIVTNVGEVSFGWLGGTQPVLYVEFEYEAI